MSVKNKTKSILLSFALLFLSVVTYSQKDNNRKNFHGAVANLKAYNAMYILNESDDKKIKAVIKNIKNALKDPRLKGKLKVELIAFGNGVELYRKANHYDTLLLGLKNQGVILAQCENTIRERNISKDELWPFISYVPSGNGEIIIRQYQGWAIVQP